MDSTSGWSSQQQIPENPNPNPRFPSIPDGLIHQHTPQPSLSALPSYISQQHHITGPNCFMSFPQPVLPSSLTSNSDIYPPGTDPSVVLTSYPSTLVGQPRWQYSDDQLACLRTWVYKQPQPIAYETAIYSSTENSNVSTTSNSLWNNYSTNQTLANDASGIIPQMPKVIQLMRCEVCKIDCNSKEVYEAHILGKKHKRNLQLQNFATSAMLLSSSNTITDIPSQMGSIGGKMISGASGVVAAEELEPKKRKLLDGGAAVDSVRFCSTCNVACNSQEVFNKHLAGKKHATQARLIAYNGVGPCIAAIRSHDSGTWRKCPKKNKVVQSSWCQVCKINCNSNDIYNKHLSGKKHQKNLEKLSNSKNDVSAPASNASPASTNPVIGAMENPAANQDKSVVQNSVKKVAESQASEKDLKAKKGKILEGGALAGAVRTCTICNVVCNSQTVFNSHLAGQKHAAMVKKQKEAGIAISCPQLISATLT